MGFLGLIQNDIKRVVAYSTLSQLGYMTVALGVSAYSVAVFHLMTHAFFKALLFLGAGSVIIGCHHNQDIRYMGGLWKRMPITWITSLLGSLALIGFPFLSGFYSKDTIIEAVHASHLWGSGYAYFAVVAGVFVTAFYSFRMYFLVFHGKERYDQNPDAHHDDHAHDAHGDHHDDHGHHDGPHESKWVVTLPLVLLAIPSVIIGYIAIEPMLYGDWFGSAVYIDAAKHPAMHELAEEFHGALAMGLHGLQFSLPFILAMAGVAVAWFFYLKKPEIPAAIARTFKPLYTLLDNKYYFDRFNEVVVMAGSRLLGKGLWKAGDQTIIDGLLVNGSAKTVGAVAMLTRLIQTGQLYLYAFAMIFGVFALLTYVYWVWLRHFV
jgi:NADH-quinone oxidoreductase subunit L